MRINKGDLEHYPKKRALRRYMRQLGFLFVVAFIMSVLTIKQFVDNTITAMTSLTLVVGVTSCIFIGLYFLEYWFPRTFVRREHISDSPLKEYVDWAKNRVSLKTYLKSTVLGSIILYIVSIFVLLALFVFTVFRYNFNFFVVAVPIFIFYLLPKLMDEIQTYKILRENGLNAEGLKQLAAERV